MSTGRVSEDRALQIRDHFPQPLSSLDFACGRPWKAVRSEAQIQPSNQQAPLRQPEPSYELSSLVTRKQVSLIK